MKAFLPLAILLTAATHPDQPRSYLLSLVSIPLKRTESIEAFSIQTWGVEFKSVCKIPAGWRIKAGGSATPEGVLEGTGSQGATWFSNVSPKELHALVLVTLDGAVLGKDVGAVPATFKGTATVSTDAGKVVRTLGYKNVLLAPARRCPSSK